MPTEIWQPLATCSDGQAQQQSFIIRLCEQFEYRTVEMNITLCWIAPNMRPEEKTLGSVYYSATFFACISEPKQS
jgi:hypothetical protein